MDLKVDANKFVSAKRSVLPATKAISNALDSSSKLRNTIPEKLASASFLRELPNTLKDLKIKVDAIGPFFSQTEEMIKEQNQVAANQIAALENTGQYKSFATMACHNQTISTASIVDMASCHTANKIVSNTNSGLTKTGAMLTIGALKFFEGVGTAAENVLDGTTQLGGWIVSNNPISKVVFLGIDLNSAKFKLGNVKLGTSQASYEKQIKDFVTADLIKDGYQGVYDNPSTKTIEKDSSLKLDSKKAAIVRNVGEVGTSVMTLVAGGLAGATEVGAVLIANAEAGRAANKAFDNNSSFNQATAYAGISYVVNGAIALVGGKNLFTKPLSGTMSVGGKSLSLFQETLARTGANIGLGVSQPLGDAVGIKLTYGNNKKLGEIFSEEQTGKKVALGALISGGLSAVSYGAQYHQVRNLPTVVAGDAAASMQQVRKELQLTIGDNVKINGSVVKSADQIEQALASAQRANRLSQTGVTNQANNMSTLRYQIISGETNLTKTMEEVVSKIESTAGYKVVSPIRNTYGREGNITIQRNVSFDVRTPNGRVVNMEIRTPSSVRLESEMKEAQAIFTTTGATRGQKLAALKKLEELNKQMTPPSDQDFADEISLVAYSITKRYKLDQFIKKMIVTKTDDAIEIGTDAKEVSERVDEEFKIDERIGD